MGKEGPIGQIWIRLMKANRCVAETTAPASRDEPEAALRETLPRMDISQPMWLPRHRADWETYAFTRFLAEHFVDAAPFDLMEVRFLYPDGVEKPARLNRSILEDV